MKKGDTIKIIMDREEYGQGFIRSYPKKIIRINDPNLSLNNQFLRSIADIIGIKDANMYGINSDNTIRFTINNVYETRLVLIEKYKNEAR
jgi:hypothetical protein